MLTYEEAYSVCKCELPDKQIDTDNICELFNSLNLYLGLYENEDGYILGNMVGSAEVQKYEQSTVRFSHDELWSFESIHNRLYLFLKDTDLFDEKPIELCVIYTN